MFEHKTFESILSDMLNSVLALDPNLDVRTGSVMYTALAPIALELETAYHEMDMIVEQTFMETASKEYLVKHGEQIGVPLNEATYAHFMGEFDVDVEIGSRFNLDKFNYTVINKIFDPTELNRNYVFELVCETEGSEPNKYLGDLTPITYVENLSMAKLVSVWGAGEDEEDTEHYRYRLQTHIKNPPADGNVAQYNEWLDSEPKVGKYKVMPCWNGTNTVKLLILDSENRKATQTLLDEVQGSFDPPTSQLNDDVENPTYPQGRGMGNGKAAIGSIVTVTTADEVPVEVIATLKLKKGYSEPTGVIDNIKKYLTSISLDKNYVEYLSIYTAIYTAESVAEIVSLEVMVNGVIMNVTQAPFINTVSIADNEIPVYDEILSSWSVQNE